MSHIAPVHHDPAPADADYDALEVDPWPHIHLRQVDDGSVNVRLQRYRGGWAEGELWVVRVKHPGSLARMVGDTLDRRIDRAIATIQRRWDRLEADAHAAYIATRRIDR